MSDNTKTSDKTSDKLLPCPFCGGEVCIDREDIFCDECHVSMRIDDRLMNREAETYEEAREQTITAWNTRKPMERILERLEALRVEHEERELGARKVGLTESADLNGLIAYIYDDAIEIVKEEM